jgi:hypothetical protein
MVSSPAGFPGSRIKAALSYCSRRRIAANLTGESGRDHENSPFRAGCGIHDYCRVRGSATLCRLACRAISMPKKAGTVQRIEDMKGRRAAISALGPPLWMELHIVLQKHALIDKDYIVVRDDLGPSRI